MKNLFTPGFFKFLLVFSLLILISFGVVVAFSS